MYLEVNILRVLFLLLTANECDLTSCGNLLDSVFPFSTAVLSSLHLRIWISAYLWVIGWISMRKSCRPVDSRRQSEFSPHFARGSRLLDQLDSSDTFDKQQCRRFCEFCSFVPVLVAVSADYEQSVREFVQVARDSNSRFLSCPRTAFFVCSDRSDLGEAREEASSRSQVLRRVLVELATRCSSVLALGEAAMLELGAEAVSHLDGTVFFDLASTQQIGHITCGAGFGERVWKKLAAGLLFGQDW